MHVVINSRQGLEPFVLPQVALGYVSMMLHQVTVMSCRITSPYKDAQNRLLWRDKTCPART